MSLRQFIGFTCLVVAVTMAVAAFAFVACGLDVDSSQGLHVAQSDQITLALLLIGGGVFAGFGIAYLCFTACNSCSYHAETVVARWQTALNHLANRIQDVLIEGNLDAEPSEPAERDPLPPLDPERLVDALDRETDELFASIVVAINQAPNGTTISEMGPEVRRIVAAWANRALVVGETLRVDAAMNELPPLAGPHTNWRRKFRRMRAAGGGWAGTADE